MSLVLNCKTCSQKNPKVIEQALDGLCERCAVISIAYNRYADSNIPVEYWSLEMTSTDGSKNDFFGPKELNDVYHKAVSNLSEIYKTGASICLAGSHGVGKTMTATCILKKACQKNYVCLYTTLSDIVSALIESPNEEKFLARKELMSVDFLVIDEFDSRFMSTESSSDLFGKTLEHIFRTRSQNKLPTILCTNSPNPIESFNGSIKNSIDSLMSRVKVIPIIGEDFRKQQGR